MRFVAARCVRGVMCHRPVTWRAIYDQVHYEGFAAGDGERGFELNVRTMIKRARAKFLAIDPGFKAIRSIFRVGYAWDP